MKKIATSLFIAAAALSISGVYANTPNTDPNDCRQYGVTYQVKTVNDPDKGYRESVTVSRPDSYSGDAHATITRERRDGSTYQTQMDSRDNQSHNNRWSDNRSMESNSGNGDRVKDVDLQCYPK